MVSTYVVPTYRLTNLVGNLWVMTDNLAGQAHSSATITYRQVPYVAYRLHVYYPIPYLTSLTFTHYLPALPKPRTIVTAFRQTKASIFLLVVGCQLLLVGR